MTYPLATPASLSHSPPRSLRRYRCTSPLLGSKVYESDLDISQPISRCSNTTSLLPFVAPIFFRFALSRVHRHRYQFIFLVLSFRDASRQIILSRSLFPRNLRNHRGTRDRDSYEYDCRWRFRRRGRQCTSRYRVFHWEMEWSVIRFLRPSITPTDAGYR